MNNRRNVQSESVQAGDQGRNSNTGSFSGPDFNTLYNQKRPTDQESVKRRESISDQYHTGFVGKMWRHWVSGSTGPTRS